MTMKKLTEKEKRDIVAGLERYAARFASRNKAAQSLSGVSPATVSALLGGKWDLVSDDMFRNVASQTGTVSPDEWQTVETTAFREMAVVMDDARRWRNVTWVVGDAGCGKTTAARRYAESHPGAFYVLCSEDMRRSDFIRETARRIGLRTDGHSIRETLDRIVDEVIRTDSPLLLFDEADKLPERVFHYFIDLYNRLEEKCGMVFLSTSYIKRRIENGLRYNKCGYNEIHSRIGRRFFEPERTSARDVYAVCVANGVTDRARISEIVRDAEAYEFDLRRVRKCVHRARVTDAER